MAHSVPGPGGRRVCSSPPALIATEECDASQAYKDAHAGGLGPEDVRIIHSPVGMPGRALNTPLVQALAEGKRFRPKHCAPVSQDLRPRRGALLHHPRPHRGA